MATKEELKQAFMEVFGISDQDDDKGKNQGQGGSGGGDDLARRLAEAEAKFASLQDNKNDDGDKNSGDDDVAKQLAETEKKIKEYQEKEVKTNVTTSLVEKGFESESVGEILEYIKYDKLRNDKGELDEDKVKEFTGAIANISLKNPPSGNLGNNKKSGASNGISKYLDN